MFEVGLLYMRYIYAQGAMYARNMNDTYNTAANMFWKIQPNQQPVDATNWATHSKQENQLKMLNNRNVAV